jgi:4-diphosphocytidyl-2-C-methyl-D-erythritol kinase
MTAGPRRVTVQAPGKVNLHFRVGGRRDDGFHEVSTTYLAVSLYDEVTVTASARRQVSLSGPATAGVPVDGSNLAVRAARLLARRGGIRPDVDIHLVKRIPVAGGMAGGSADAAGTLIACNALWQLGLSTRDLLGIAAELGSDVPFSVLGGAALATGRGERLRPLAVGGDFHFVFATAGVEMSTPAVYVAVDRVRGQAGQAVRARDRGRPGLPVGLIEALTGSDVRAIGALMDNDLEPLVGSLLPALVDTRRVGMRAGALGGVLCGTGATYAFLVADGQHARRVADSLLAAGTGASVVTARGPVPGPRCAAGDGTRTVREPVLAR